jgi:hypothetical protein
MDCGKGFIAKRPLPCFLRHLTRGSRCINRLARAKHDVLFVDHQRSALTRNSATFATNTRARLPGIGDFV